MQIEVYNMTAEADNVTIQLEAVCDSFSSLLWDVQFYDCGAFEVYIAANSLNLSTFRIGKIIGRDDDKQHFGIIESVDLKTDAENGDYLTIKGRFLMSLLSRRIIGLTLSFTTATSYSDILRTAVQRNCMQTDNRKIPGLQLGTVSGACWMQTTKLQISYSNLMEWIYKICELVKGTANIRLQETAPASNQYTMLFELSEGEDRSITQDENPHIVFSDSYNNLLSFEYALDSSDHSNFAYIYGNVDPRTVDRSSLVDIDDVEIDRSLSKRERIEDYVRQVKNPYCYLQNGIVVKISFSGKESLESCVSRCISQSL